MTHPATTAAADLQRAQRRSNLVLAGFATAAVAELMAFGLTSPEYARSVPPLLAVASICAYVIAYKWLQRAIATPLPGLRHIDGRPPKDTAESVSAFTALTSRPIALAIAAGVIPMAYPAAADATQSLLTALNRL